jgi:hypothetical protein
MFNLGPANNAVSLALLLPLAAIAAWTIFKTSIQDASREINNIIGLRNLISLFRNNKEIRNSTLAYMFIETLDVSLSILVFELAKNSYGATSNIPAAIGGVAIYAAMALGRAIASYLQNRKTIDEKSTYIASAVLSLLGIAGFFTGFFIFDAAIASFVSAGAAFVGIANFTAPLMNATSTRNGHSEEIGLSFMTIGTAAIIPILTLGALIDTSPMLVFIIPAAALAGILFFGRHILQK